MFTQGIINMYFDYEYFNAIRTVQEGSQWELRSKESIKFNKNRTESPIY